MKNNRVISITTGTIYFTAILMAIYIGTSIGGGGPRVRFLLLATAPFSLLFVERLTQKGRFWLLLAAILLVSVQIPKIPLKFSLSELVLMVLAIVAMITRQHKNQPVVKQKVGVISYLPYIIFAFAGLISAVQNAELEIWHTVGLTPLLLMLVTKRMVHTEDDAMAIIRSALISLFGFLCLLGVADLTGNVVNLSPGWRFAGHLIVTLGPIEHIIFSITLGALVGLGFPAVIILLFRKVESIIARFLYGLILVLFIALLILTASRGATFAATATSFLVLILSGRLFRFKNITSVAVAALFFIIIFWYGIVEIFSLFPQLEHFSVLKRGVTNVDEFQQRINILKIAIDNISQRPLGYGFNYLWSSYRLDEAIVYSALLNGTGLMGFLGFILIIGHLLYHFTRRIRSALPGSQRDLVAIGLSTLVAGLLIGVSSESVMLYPVHAMVFWTILSAAYSGTCLAHYR